MRDSNRFTDDQLAQYHEDGYIIVKQLFTAEEIDLLESVTKADPHMSSGGVMKDADGGESRIWITNEEGQDICNAIARSGRLIAPMEQLLGGPVYIWHYKMMLKEPRVGGAWEWHQDYGYWYGDKCLFPNLASCMISVNRATRENGCLQVLKGSHKMGRIEHDWHGGQSVANIERTDAAESRLELVCGEIEPGDALFFHCNTLHRSDANTSEHPRWTFICCYNAMDNMPYHASTSHGQSERAEIWDDSLIMDYGKQQLAKLEGHEAS
jgi:hypothetical protein